MLRPLCHEYTLIVSTSTSNSMHTQISPLLAALIKRPIISFLSHHFRPSHSLRLEPCVIIPSTFPTCPSPPLPLPQTWPGAVGTGTPWLAQTLSLSRAPRATGAWRALSPAPLNLARMAPCQLVEGGGSAGRGDSAGRR